ncbi:hypothetical protein Tco_0231396 [Tanacetum coccineum]
MTEDGFRAYWLGSERVIPNKGDPSDYWVEISSGRDFLRGAPSYTYIRDPVRRRCHGLISYNTYGETDDQSGTKTSSKFNTIVCEYVTEPSMLSKSRAELRKKSDFKSVEVEEKV